MLRTFAEISNGLNIVIDPAINGTVDISLRDVPWDQALDIILRANKLGYILEGNIVRIVPLTVLAQEREEQRKLADATALAGDLRVLTRPLSYAKAADLVTIITRSSLSSRGDVQVDARTNTLIIRDLADRLTNAAELITALDRPQPQVEIEARIVQVDRNASKELGILWGVGGRIDPSVGTTTGLTFPSSVVGSAATGQRPAPCRRSVQPGNRPERHQPGAGIGDRRPQSRCATAGARVAGQEPHSLDAPRRHAEQRRGQITPGLADPDSDGVEQHRHGHLQGRRPDAEGHAADHRGEHRDHADLRRESRAELQPGHRGSTGAVH